MALKKSMETLQAQMAEMMKMMISGGQAPVQTQPAQPKTPQPDQSKVVSDAVIKEREIIEANKNKYKRLGESNMNLWVSKNWDDIMVMPEENRLEIEDKYLKLYGVPFPTSRV